MKRLYLATFIFIVLIFSPNLLTFFGYSSYSQTLYAHAETTTIGGSSYYLQSLSPADGNGTLLSASAVIAGRKLMGRWVYPLSGIVSIPASTWTVTYRAMKSASAKDVVAHGDIDILIRKADGTIRNSIASDVANSPSLTLTNVWETLTGTYDWPGYTVVDQTDYLEVEYYIEVTTPQNSKSVSLLVDDGTLPQADQTKIENVMFTHPNQAPVASFTFSPSNPLIYDTVTFNASASYDPDGSIVSYTWDFGDGNVTTVTDPIITHVYTTAESTVNYTVTLTVTDNEGSTGSVTDIVPVTNPSILYVSLPAGTYVGPNPDHWLSQCWRLNITALSETFTIRINNTHASFASYDTHLIIALNNASYEYLESLTVDSTTIPKSSFIYGKPEPYGFTLTWEEDVYPAWFSDTYVVGTVDPKGYKDAEVSVTFSNATGVRMHFDAYGSQDSSPPPANKGHVTHNPHQKDSTVLFWSPPVVKYYLTVGTDPEGITTISGEGWYDNCTYVDLTAPLYVPDEAGVDGERYMFTHWTVDGDFEAGNPIIVHMDANHTAITNYVKQYLVTFNQTGLDDTATGTVVTINDTQLDYANLPFTIWVNESSWISYAYNDVVPSTVSGKRFKLVSIIGPSASFCVTEPVTVTGNYKTQYYLTVNTNPAEVLTLNPAAVSGQGWYDSGSTATVSAVQNVDKVAGQSRYDFRSWTGATPTGVGNQATVLMDGPKTATANYQLQFKITFDQTGVGSDFTGTVVDIDGVGYGVANLPASFWWDNTSVYTFAFQSPLIVASDAKQYVWTSTAGLSTLQSGSVTILASGNITGNYKTQYYLTVSSPYDSPTPTSGWFDAETSITASVTSPWPGPTGVQYVCTGWSGTGNVPVSGTTTSVIFTINEPSSIIWNWKTQYYLTVQTDPAGLSPAPTPSSGWHDEGTDVVLTAPDTSYLASDEYSFEYWDVNGDSQGIGVNPITVTMNQPRTATAYYTLVAPPPPPLSVTISPLSATINLGDSVMFTSTVTGGTAPYSYQWYLTGNPVSGATSSSWAFTPTSSGIYYVYLKVTDANNNVARSETARITVSVVPVGGYSVSLTKPAAKTPLICYTMLLAIFGVAISLMKRKRK